MIFILTQNFKTELSNTIDAAVGAAENQVMSFSWEHWRCYLKAWDSLLPLTRVMEGEQVGSPSKLGTRTN